MKWKENIESRGGFSKVLKENFSIDAGNFPVVLDTPNIYSRVRTNMEGRKSIIVDQFNQDFLEATNFFGGGAFLRFSWPHKKHEFHFFASLKNLKNMNFIFCKLKKPQKTWTSFFASLKNMNLIFCKIKNLKKYEIHLLQA